MRARAVLGAVTLAAASCGPGTGPIASGDQRSRQRLPRASLRRVPGRAVSPLCTDGACEVPTVLTGLILAVSLSEDSYFAPGQTFAIPFEHLNDATISAGCAPDPPLPCANLPGYGIVQGAYLVTPQEQSPAALDWNLGNPGVSTALPVQVTYRALWPPDAAVVGRGRRRVPGLAVRPHPGRGGGRHLAEPARPAPARAPSIGFQANLQPASTRPPSSPTRPSTPRSLRT